MRTISEEFRAPGVDARGMFRCWFPDAGADLDRVEHQVRSVYAAGFGGMEVAMVPQYVDFDPREYGWATPRWKEILRRILRTAAGLPEHFKIDLTITAHWPPALNTIDPNHPAAQKEVRYTLTRITQGGTLELPLPPTRTCDDDAGDAAHFIFTDTFLCAVTARIAGKKNGKYILEQASMRDVSEFVTVLDRTAPAGIALDEDRFGAKPKLADVQHFYAIDLDAAGIAPSEAEAWEPGDVLLFACYTRGTGQSLSGRSMTMFHLELPMADKMYATDYYCTEGTDAIIDVWEKNILDDPEIRSLMEANGGAIFEDSIELACATIPWTNRFAEEFRSLRGYDVLPYMPVLLSLKGSEKKFLTDGDIARLLVDDYYTTLNDLYLRDHVECLKTWTRTFGCQYRAQSYGGDVNTAAASCVLDIAEGESLGFGSMREYFRNIAGGVHMTGRKFLSDEILADLMKGYCLDWKSAADTLNSNWAAGVNRAVIHGMSYESEVSGKYSQWPGWHAFMNAFADPWGERQPYWENVHALSDMIARTQGILQNGRPQVDLAVYKGQRAYGWGYTRLLRDGYSYDIISNPHLFLPQAVVRDGELCPDGPAYRALLVVDQQMLPADAAQALLKLAQTGLPVLFVGDLPACTNGAFTPDALAAEKVQAMLQLENVQHVPDLDAAVQALQAAGIAPRAAWQDLALEPVCRTDESGTYYFIYNGGDAVQANITLQGSGKPVLLDCWSGAETPLPFTEAAGGVQVSLSFAPGEARVIALQPAAAPAQLRIPLADVPLSSFDTTLESWGPDPASAVPTVSKKTLLALGERPCAAWDALPVTPTQLEILGVDSLEHVAGRGIYRTAFTLPACAGAVLTVQTGDCMVVAGTVNGHPLPAVNQRSGAVDLTGLVQPGRNTLELIIATPLINRLRIAHPLFDGVGGMPAPPAPGEALEGPEGEGSGEPGMGNLPDPDYELQNAAPMDMPVPGGGAYHNGILSASVQPYR